MPLDPNIILGLKTPEAPDLLGMASKAMTLKSLSQTNQIRGQEIQDDLASRDAYRKNITVGPDGMPTLNRAGMLSQLAQTNPAAVPELSQKFAVQDAAQQDLKLKVMGDHIQARKMALNTIPVGNQATPEEKQTSWSDMKKQLGQLGLPTDMYPDQYPGDDHANAMRTTLQSAEEKLAQHNKDRDFRLSQQKADTEAFAAGAPVSRGQGAASGKSAINDPNTDPATLIAGRVPTSAQKAVQDEIKNRQDLKALGPKILAAFDRGTSRNPVEAAQGRSEFEGLINTTVQEQEGTARKAAFDSIHENMSPKGLTALPGQDDSRRRTVEEYLKSKGSAPASMSHRINLDNYKSTRLSFKTVQMRDPKGNIRAVPEDQVDDAKAAGGKPL